MCQKIRQAEATDTLFTGFRLQLLICKANHSRIHMIMIFTCPLLWLKPCSQLFTISRTAQCIKVLVLAFIMQQSYKLPHIFTDLPPPCSPWLEARELRLDVGARWRWRWLRAHTKALLSGQLIGTVVRPGDGPREWWVTCARRGVRGRLDHDQVGELVPSLAV